MAIQRAGARLWTNVLPPQQIHPKFDRLLAQAMALAGAMACSITVFLSTRRTVFTSMLSRNSWRKRAQRRCGHSYARLRPIMARHRSVRRPVYSLTKGSLSLIQS